MAQIKFIDIVTRTFLISYEIWIYGQEDYFWRHNVCHKWCS